MEHYPNHNSLSPQELETLRKDKVRDKAVGGMGDIATHDALGYSPTGAVKRLEGETLNGLGVDTSAEGQVAVEVFEQRSDPDSGSTKDFDRRVGQVSADVEQQLDTFGIDPASSTPVKETVEDRLVSEAVDEQVSGRTDLETDAVTTDRDTLKVRDAAFAEVVSEDLEGNEPSLAISQKTQRDIEAALLGSKGSGYESNKRLQMLGKELKAEQDDPYGIDETIISLDEYGNEVETHHNTALGRQLMHVLAGDLETAAKSLSEDGREQLFAKVEDLKEKYAVNRLSDATLEQHDLHKLEQIFYRESKNTAVRNIDDYALVA